MPCSSWAKRLRSNVARLYGSAGDGGTSVENRRGTTLMTETLSNTSCQLAQAVAAAVAVGGRRKLGENWGETAKRRRGAVCRGIFRGENG